MPQTSLSIATLDHLFPVNELSPDHRHSLIERGRILDLPAGQRLVAAKEHGWLLYLVAGHMHLIKDGITAELRAGSAGTRHPLFIEGRLRDEAVAQQDCQVLQLDRKLFGILREQQSLGGYQVEDFELSDVEGTIFAEIYQACTSGKLDLPALPDVAIRIQAAIKDPDIDIMKLVRIVEQDLAVTGGLLRSANSAMHGGNKPVGNIRDAIVRLGMTISKRLAMTIAMQQIFRSPSTVMHQRLRGVWEQSVYVSALSYVIAKWKGEFDPERALLCGLLHSVGVVPILDYIARNHGELSPEAIDAVVLKLQGLVGEIVVGYWGLNSNMNEVVRDSANWNRDHAHAADYTDVVLVARLYYLNQAQPDAMVPRYHEIPAFKNLGLSVPDAEGRVVEIEEGMAKSKDLLLPVAGGR